MEDKTDPQQAHRKPPKIAIIGAGQVGATLAYTLAVERVAGELVLVDINKERAGGQAMDISHAIPFSAPTNVHAGDYAEAEGSDIFVITAGVAQKPGESRLDLVTQNVNIFREIVRRLKDIVGDAVILVVSNPVDVLTYATVKLSGSPWQRVVGAGTILDTARLRYELGANCRVDPRNVHAYVIGEHGDSEVPLWSLINVAGMSLGQFCDICGRECSQAYLDAIFHRVRDAAYQIIALKGATYYAIALGTTRMIEAILRDQHSVITASTLLQGQYGIQDVCLSLPVVLGLGGVQRVIEVGVSKQEEEALQNSAKVLRGVLDNFSF